VLHLSLVLVAECEATTFEHALQIFVNCDYNRVNFESDCQIVVNTPINGGCYDNELDTLLCSCRSLISSNSGYNLSYVRRQANKIA